MIGVYMRRFWQPWFLINIMIGAGFWGGCQPAKPLEGVPLAEGFQVRKVKLQPSFTRWQQAEVSVRPGQIQAAVELTDQFGDPIKSVGEFRFELFHYQPAFNDHRGRRLETYGIQTFNLTQVNQNQQAWDRITRSYRFLLKSPDDILANNSPLVLQVTFTQGEFRLLDNLVLNSEKTEAH